MSIALSTGTSVISLVLGSIGLVGVLTNDEDAIQGVPWATASNSGKDLFFGVIGGYVEDIGWNDYDGGDCEDVQNATMGTGVVGWIFLLLASIIAIVRNSGNTSPILGTINLVLIALSFLMMLVAMGVWVNGCYNSDDFDSLDDLTIGAGLGLWIVGWIFALISTVISACGSFTGESTNTK